MVTKRKPNTHYGALAHDLDAMRRAKAQLVDHRRSVAEGELVRVADLDALLHAAQAAFLNRLESLPGRTAAVVELLHSPPEQRAAAWASLITGFITYCTQPYRDLMEKIREEKTE